LSQVIGYYCRICDKFVSEEKPTKAMIENKMCADCTKKHQIARCLRVVFLGLMSVSIVLATIAFSLFILSVV
jgi:hypothetical protein